MPIWSGSVARCPGGQCSLAFGHRPTPPRAGNDSHNDRFILSSNETACFSRVVRGSGLAAVRAGFAGLCPGRWPPGREGVRPIRRNAVSTPAKITTHRDLHRRPGRPRGRQPARRVHAARCTLRFRGVGPARPGASVPRACPSSTTELQWRDTVVVGGTWPGSEPGLWPRPRRRGPGHYLQNGTKAPKCFPVPRLAPVLCGPGRW